VDSSSLATASGKGPVAEIKEWQAIMDHLRSLPVSPEGSLPVFPLDDRAQEVRAIKAA
jgi:5'-nucleotidase